MPHYLPDGRIVFSSTRQRQARAILLDENKPQYAAQDEDGNEAAFILHVMDDDGTNIHQMSFNQSHDLDPAVLANGQIVFTRWEHHIDDNQFDLYRIKPDGTESAAAVRRKQSQHRHARSDDRSADTIQFLNPRPMQDGRTLALMRPFQGTNEGGDLVLIDTANLRRQHAADRGQRRHDRPCADDVRCRPTCARRSGTLARRPLSFRRAAVRWHQSLARQLVAVPAARGDAHRAVYAATTERDQSAAGGSAAAVRHLHL